MKDGRVLFWIADLTGHGAAAALLTSLAKLLFDHGSMDHDSPASLMEGVDNDFRSIFGARSFMTAMAVALDPATGQAQVVGAGHPPLLVVRRNCTTESIASVAPPLGMIKRAAFTETAITVEPGDAFLLYTDGLFRGTKDERHLATPQELEKVLNHSAPSAEALLKRIVTRPDPENSAKPAPDDVAAIAVRREDRQ
jgi:sigma-B regulation protein RsbU (phosphoserine phosphatase)